METQSDTGREGTVGLGAESSDVRYSMGPRHARRESSPEILATSSISAITRIKDALTSKKSGIQGLRRGSKAEWWSKTVTRPEAKPMQRITIAEEFMRATVETAAQRNPSYHPSMETSRSLTLKVLRSLSRDMGVRSDKLPVEGFYNALKSYLDTYASRISSKVSTTKGDTFVNAWIFAELVNEVRLLDPQTALGYLRRQENLEMISSSKLRDAISGMYAAMQNQNAAFQAAVGDGMQVKEYKKSETDPNDPAYR